MKFIINTKQISSGFIVQINANVHEVTYPKDVWQALPSELRLQFAEFVSFFTTVHLTFKKNHHIFYDFPSPLSQGLYMYGLLLSMSENLADAENPKRKTSEYIKDVLNSFYKISFAKEIRSVVPYKKYTPDAKSIIMPFSFGKDSLLTFGLCKELGLTPHLFYMVEPIKKYENSIKLKLAKEFTKEFSQLIHTISVPMSELKEWKGYAWGWDIFLTQYLLFLIPYIHYYRASFFLWSNGAIGNIYDADAEGFYVNKTFDQSSRWVSEMNTFVRNFGSSATVSSIIDPLPELSILYILHHRYPKIGKYQTSCFNELSKTKRWCGKCSECRKVYLYLAALDIDPTKVGFAETILKKRMRRVNIEAGYWKDRFVYFKKEMHYARNLAIRQNIYKTRSKYIDVQSGISMPQQLRVPLMEIYKQEVEKLKQKIH